MCFRSDVIDFRIRSSTINLHTAPGQQGDIGSLGQDSQSEEAAHPDPELGCEQILGTAGLAALGTLGLGINIISGQKITITVNNFSTVFYGTT